MSVRLPGTIVACLSWLLAVAVEPVWADRLVLTTGRAMVVASAALEGDVWRVRLTSGGEARIRVSLVREVEYRNDLPAPTTVVAPAPAHLVSLTPAERPSARADLSGRPFAAIIDRVASAHGVDPALVHAVIQTESNYQPRARSPKGAKGLMQLMPDTARAYGLRNPYDPASNIDAGVRHLRSLLDRFDLRLALAAYNAGAGAVERARGLPPFAETTAYVTRVLDLMGQ